MIKIMGKRSMEPEKVKVYEQKICETGNIIKQKENLLVFR